MKESAEFQALQNATTGLNLTVHEWFPYDKRKKVSYFLQRGNETVSPICDYLTLNYFLLGYRKCFIHNVN